MVCAPKASNQLLHHPQLQSVEVPTNVASGEGAATFVRDDSYAAFTS